MRSTTIVTNEALGLTSGSRIESTTGLTNSPARPTRNTALNPIVVAAKRSESRAALKGFRSAPQRKARNKYTEQMINIAAPSRYGSELQTARRTSTQSRLRPNHHRRTEASRHRTANSTYLR